MNQLSKTGRVAQAALTAAVMISAPTAALAQSDPYAGVLGIWGGILVIGGIISAIAMVAVTNSLGKR